MSAAMLTRVVVGVDFGVASGAAVAAAGALVAATGASLTVVHVETLDVPPYFTGAQMAALEVERAAARYAAEDYVRAFVRAHTRATPDVQIVEGSPVDALLEAARGADLLVVGTDSRRGLRRWWLGSVAEAVVRASHVPVLVVRATPESDVNAAAGVPGGAGLFAGPGVRVLAAEPVGTSAARWIAILRSVCGARVSTLAGMSACSREALAASDLLVVSNRSDAVGPEAAEVLKSCAHPVLFVPDAVFSK